MVIIHRNLEMWNKYNGEEAVGSRNWKKIVLQIFEQKHTWTYHSDRKTRQFLDSPYWSGGWGEGLCYGTTFTRSPRTSQWSPETLNITPVPQTQLFEFPKQYSLTSNIYCELATILWSHSKINSLICWHVFW